ncbi:hypothetical protein CRENBAI_024181 [Crenichthys baileyi]|uniref:Uncharacterized protein n=1 Tax=Crenichthys baileyi TaxID=28760 RepID=A0AAV9RW05_9TELE
MWSKPEYGHLAWAGLRYHCFKGFHKIAKKKATSYLSTVYNHFNEIPEKCTGGIGVFSSCKEHSMMLCCPLPHRLLLLIAGQLAERKQVPFSEHLEEIQIPLPENISRG